MGLLYEKASPLAELLEHFDEVKVKIYTSDHDEAFLKGKVRRVINVVESLCKEWHCHVEGVANWYAIGDTVYVTVDLCDG